MNETKSIPTGIWLFIGVIFLFVIWYFYALLTTEGLLDVFLSFSLISVIWWFDLLFTIGLLFVVSYGFIKRKNWARIFVIGYILWSAFWAIVMIIDGNEVLLHYLLFILYVVLMMYLLLSTTAKKKKKSQRTSLFSSKDVYRYGEYTLHSKEVKLRSGRMQIIYFFSKRSLENVQPCSKPESYIVSVNKKTGMPYLKKERKMI